LLAPNCKTAQWGIITNADYIQLFRRHGKIVLPATPNYIINKNNINTIIADINNLISQLSRPLTI
jgi:chromosome partitioning protein